MKKFLILYRSPISAEQQMASADPEQGQAGMDLWTAWMHKAGDALVDGGAPLGTPLSLPKGGANGAPFATGYSILQAGSLEEVRSLLEGHPHLLTPGGAFIDVQEMLAIPGMG